jgi:hypothetical protein
LFTNSKFEFKWVNLYRYTEGYRGSPVASVNWYAWDGNMTRSQKGDVLLQVLCPLGFYKKVNLSAGGAVQVKIQLTHCLKAPSFNPCACKVCVCVR